MKQKIQVSILGRFARVALVFIAVATLLNPAVASTKTWDIRSLLNQSTESEMSFPQIESRSPRKTMWVVATAYSSTADQTDASPCITANGFNLCEYYSANGVETTIAANFLPMNAKVRLDDVFGDRMLVVRDRMNERYGYGRIDVWMPTREQAKAFGVKWIEMEMF